MRHEYNRITPVIIENYKISHLHIVIFKLYIFFRTKDIVFHSIPDTLHWLRFQANLGCSYTSQSF